jgi:hypothetical protein
MKVATKFQFRRRGGIILVLKIVSALHHAVHQMTQYRLYQGLIYFQNVTQFQGKQINIIPFMPITTVQPLHDSFPQNYNVVSRDGVVCIATR